MMYFSIQDELLCVTFHLYVVQCKLVFFKEIFLNFEVRKCFCWNQFIWATVDCWFKQVLDNRKNKSSINEVKWKLVIFFKIN